MTYLLIFRTDNWSTHFLAASCDLTLLQLCQETTLKSLFVLCYLQMSTLLSTMKEAQLVKPVYVGEAKGWHLPAFLKLVKKWQLRVI